MNKKWSRLIFRAIPAALTDLKTMKIQAIGKVQARNGLRIYAKKVA